MFRILVACTHKRTVSYSKTSGSPLSDIEMENPESVEQLLVGMLY